MGKHGVLRVTNNLERIVNAILEKPDHEFHGYAVMDATGLASGQVYRAIYRLVDIGWVEELDAGNQSDGPRITYRVRPEGLRHLYEIRSAAGTKAPTKAGWKSVPITKGI